MSYTLQHVTIYYRQLLKVVSGCSYKWLCLENHVLSDHVHVLDVAPNLAVASVFINLVGMPL